MGRWKILLWLPLESGYGGKASYGEERGGEAHWEAATSGAFVKLQRKKQ